MTQTRCVSRKPAEKHKPCLSASPRPWGSSRGRHLSQASSDLNSAHAGEGVRSACPTHAGRRRPWAEGVASRIPGCLEGSGLRGPSGEGAHTEREGARGRRDLFPQFRTQFIRCPCGQHSVGRCLGVCVSSSFRRV